jgi:hypothetical protein
MALPDAAPHKTRPHIGVVRLISAAFITLVAVILALAGTGGTYAFLSSSRPILLVPTSGATSATITAGTANLAVAGPSLDAKNLYPGEIRSTNITVSTSGTVALGLSVSAITGTRLTSFVASVAGGSCASTAPPVTAGALRATVSPGAPVTLCVRIGLAPDAPATSTGTTGTIVIEISGTQS